MSHLQFLQTAGVVALLAAAAAPKAVARFDGVDDKMVADSASAFALQTISMKTAATVQAWCESDDLSDEEGAADRLMAMLVGIADDNKDGELDDDEQMIVEAAMNEAWSYMASKGVSEEDLDLLFNSEDPAEANSAGARVMEFVAGKLPDGDEAAADEMDDFAFGAEAQQGVFDAVYKKRFSIRGGKKVIKRVRVAGVVRLNAKQKVAIRKAQRKAHGSKATAKRMKSMRVRKAMHL